MAKARASTTHVYCTDELMQRPARSTDYLREKRAMQDLAAQMADSPEGVLPHFVDLAMELTGGVAAGLSLYEKDPMPGVFRWREAEAALGKSMSAGALEKLAVDAGSLNEDFHATREYRANLVAVMAKRAVAKIAGK